MNFKKFIKIDFNNTIKKYRTELSGKISGKNVLVIGGAGTIGSNYIKQILNYNPRKIVVVDNNENGLTELTRDLRSSNLLEYNPEFITYPVNLLSNIFNKIFLNGNFHIVANFAAHKHVRSEKDILSIEALIKNNVYGAIKLLNLCEKKPPDYFFSVSTDKAANPVNVMGASKSLMEKLIMSKQNKFRVSTARFANVAFSNGSLLDGFYHRINKQQPLACPSDIKRFFVTQEQSGEICLLSTFLCKTGTVFFPKLDFNNDQIYFKEIAIEFLNQKGFIPLEVDSEKSARNFDFSTLYKNYPILFFNSDTSGEKTYEEFYSENEEVFLDDFDSLGYIKSDINQIKFNNVIKDFDDIFAKNDIQKSDIINVIIKYVADFTHIEKGKNLDEKM
jgi:FlaA1/EpsC-like NDP-sugar epimerase